MVISTNGDFRILISAFLIGFLLGAVYDCFRILRISLFSSERKKRQGKLFDLLSKIQRKKITGNKTQTPIKNHRFFSVYEYIFVFFNDVLFSMIVTAATILFIFTANMGRIRLYILSGELFGFLIYYHTVGRIIIYFSELIIALIDTLLKLLYNISVYPILCGFVVVLHFFKKHLGICLQKMQNVFGYWRDLRWTRQQKRILIRFAANGFDLKNEGGGHHDP